MFGLSPRDLTDEQLTKLDFKKLLELLDKDPRVEQIVGDKLLDESVESLEYFKNFESGELDNYKYVLKQYNSYYRREKGEMKKKNSYYSYRSDSVFWHMLDSCNRQLELKRWADKEDSIINEDNVDYEWLYTNNVKLADEVAERAIANGKSRYHGSINSSTLHLLKHMPRHKVDDLMPKIFELDKNVYMYALTNEYLPQKYTAKALRVLAKRRNIPTIHAKITPAVLQKLPTVMRLEVIEAIMYYHSNNNTSYRRRARYSHHNNRNTASLPFVDMNEEKLKALLFGSSMRHNHRVEKVVKRYKTLTGEEE
jgi:hypothetical protein